MNLKAGQWVSVFDKGYWLVYRVFETIDVSVDGHESQYLGYGLKRYLNDALKKSYRYDICDGRFGMVKQLSKEKEDLITEFIDNNKKDYLIFLSKDPAHCFGISFSLSDLEIINFIESKIPKVEMTDVEIYDWFKKQGIEESHHPSRALVRFESKENKIINRKLIYTFRDIYRYG